MRLALSQIDPVVGDLEGNRELILTRIEEAKAAGADLVVFPELAVTGYPPEDLLLRPGFVRAARASIERIAAETRDIVALVGAPLLDDDLYNACAICAEGRVTGWAKKWHLPNYGVFDEKRYFASGDAPAMIDVAGTKVGITICEDMWVPGPPTTELALAGAEVVVNLSASPFHVGRAQEREAIFSARARESGVRVALCNMVGGQDELIFDGHSLVIESDGSLLARAPGFEETLLVVDLERPEAATLAPLDDDLEQMRCALVLGLRDYVAQERIRGRRRGRLGWHRLGPHGCARRGGARTGARALRLDAVPVLVRGHEERRAATRREPRLRLPRAPDRAGRRGVRRRARGAVRRTQSPTSRRRTSRRGSAARS